MSQIHWDRPGLVQCQVSLLRNLGFAWQEVQQQVLQVLYKIAAELNEGKRVQEITEGKKRKGLLSASVKSHQETQKKPSLQDTWDFHASDYFCVFNTVY